MIGTTNRYGVFLTVLILGGSPLSGADVNYEEAPINYSRTPPDNRVTHLQQQLSAGAKSLEFEEPQGYLKSVLRELKIPVTSQALVFSKTSLQKDHVGPQTPRAIYFNDDVIVGYVQHGVLEIAACDSRLGMAFYTMEQTSQAAPVFQQRTNNCLTCHSTGRTRNVPGLQVRSVFPDQEGQPVIAAGSFLSTHASPLNQRWGGWYVTGTHGDQSHLGNFTITEKKKPKQIDNSAGQNIRVLSSLCDLKPYLSPHSDIVALMVLEHQADTINALTQAGFEVRHAQYLSEQAQSSDPETQASMHRQLEQQIEQAAESIVSAFLFTHETPLTAQIQGTSEFAREFTERGPHDEKGRSLRDFDLKSRMFRYPCSYLIYSRAFDDLPTALRHAVYRRLHSELSEHVSPNGHERQSPEIRTAVMDILRSTKPELAKCWTE